MAINRAIQAGRAFIELFIKDAGAKAALTSVARDLQSTGRRITAIGAGLQGASTGIVAPLLFMAKEFAKFGDEIDKSSSRTGVAAAALSQLKFAAEQTGSGLEALEKGFAGQSRSIHDLRQGLSTAEDAFGRLNIKLSDLDGLAPEEQMLKLADGLAQVADASTQGAIAQEIFGRSGRQLIPLLSLGAKGMQELAAEADRLGLTISGKAATSAANLDDAWNRVISTFRAVRIAIGGAIADNITDIADRVAVFTSRVITVVKANGDFIRTLLKVGLAIGAIGAAVTTIGLGLIFAGQAILTSIALFAAFGSAISFVVSTVLSLTSPLGILLAAIGSIGFYLQRQTGIVTRTAGVLASVFRSVAGTAKEAFAGIGNALAGGDLQLAAEVLWASLNLEFTKGSQNLKGLWFDAIDAIKVAWEQFKEDMILIAVQIGNAIEAESLRWNTDIQNGWDQTILDFRTGWQKAIDFLANEITQWTDPALDIAEQQKALQQNSKRVIDGLQQELNDAVVARGAIEQTGLNALDESLANTRRVFDEFANSTATQDDGRATAIQQASDKVASAQKRYEEAIVKAARAREEAPDSGALLAAFRNQIDGLTAGVAEAVGRTVGPTRDLQAAEFIFRQPTAATREEKLLERNARATEDSKKLLQSVDKSLRNLSFTGSGVLT